MASNTSMMVVGCTCSFAYSIVVRRIATNDSITSCAMEAVSLKVLNSSAVFPNGAFAYTQRGCCGGQAPNFFTSYPTGLQVRKFDLPHRCAACHSCRGPLPETKWQAWCDIQSPTAYGENP